MTKKKTIPSFKKEIITYEYDWTKIPVGSKFTVNKNGKEISGRIQKQGKYIYLCQNTLNGSNVDNKLEYKYSFCIAEGTSSKIVINKLSNLEITLDPDFIVPEVIKVAGRVVIFQKGKIKVGCSTITNKEVINIMANLID